MSTHQPQPTTSLPAGEALEAYRLAKINSSGQAVYADAGDRPQYLTLEKIDTVGEMIGLRSLNAGGSIEVITEAAVTNVGAVLYCRNDGKISESSADSAVRVGYAKKAGAINGTVEAEISVG